MLMLSSSLPYPHLIHQYKCYIIASDQAFSISSSITLRWLHSALIHSGSALWVVGRPLYKAFADLRRHYGDINCIKVGFKDVVVIHGYRNVQRALVSEGKKFSNRPDITWTQLTQRHGETERATVQHPSTVLTPASYWWWFQGSSAPMGSSTVSSALSCDRSWLKCPGINRPRPSRVFNQSLKSWWSGCQRSVCSYLAHS